MKLQKIFTYIVVSLAIIMYGCGNQKTGLALNTDVFDNATIIEGEKPTKKTSVKDYKKIYIATVEVIPAIKKYKQTPTQQKMYEEIESYLNQEYKKIITASKKYTLMENKAKDTLVLESSISAVEVHFHDKEWNQHTPIAMGLNTVSLDAYMYEFVRLFGQMRFVDSQTGKVLSDDSTLLKDEKISITGDDLEFENLKAALDAWLRQVKKNLEK